MAILYLDGKRLIRLIHASTKWLLANEGTLNEINVFPVPDGDTGTNMGLTLKSISRAIADSDIVHLPHVADNAAKAALMGARGNSGVILAQIFRGFSDGIGKKHRLSSMDIAYALKKAYEKAYVSVLDPVEGTILTVVRDGVDIAYEKAKTEADISIMIEALLCGVRKSLLNTPDLLPVLKEAGVVDAGAMGFVYIIEGIYMLLKGHDIPKTDMCFEKAGKIQAINTGVDDFFGYCCEFFLHSAGQETENLKGELQKMGESLVVAASDDMIKIHIHTKTPGSILDRCSKYGVMTDIKIENMDKQHAELTQKKEEKETVIIAVALGEGVEKIFKSLGCDYVIKGGQTMNPSVEELNAAVQNYNAANYIFLPNNVNVIFAAEQVKTINPEKNIIVIPTKSIPEGFSAVLAYNVEFSIEDNTGNMNAAHKNIKSGQITRAVKDSAVNGVSIRAGDIIALNGESVLNTFTDAGTAVIELVENIIDEDDEIMSLYYGQDIREEAAQKLGNILREKFNGVEVEIHHGGQPHYFYIVSIE